MPFGVVSGVSRGMDVLDGDNDRRKGKGSFGENLGCPIVTNGDFPTRLFPNYFGQYLLLLLLINVILSEDCSRY